MATLCANLKQLALPLALSMFLCAATSQVLAQASVEGEKLAVLPAAVDAAIAPAALTTEDLERRFYAKTYEGESAQKRLARLEISVFGELRQGRPESDRLHDLNNAVLEKERAALTAGAVGAAKLATRKPEGGKKKETYLTWYRKAGADIRLKRYHAAADELLEAIKLNPRFPNAYAYMGDVLLKLKDREGAKEAYKACFEVDPAGRYGRYGRAKLLGLAHQEAYQRTAPQDSPKVVERTINTINRQSNDLASRYQLEYHHSSLWKNTLASIAQRRLLEAANANHAARSRGGQRQLDYYGGRIGHGNEVSDMAMINGYWALSDFAVQSYRARAEAARKAALVAQSAADLKAQMLQPVSPGGPSLRALGTNLYVRYYGNENSSIVDPPAPDDPVVELAAQAKKLKPAPGK